MDGPNNNKKSSLFSWITIIISLIISVLLVNAIMPFNQSSGLYVDGIPVLQFVIVVIIACVLAAAIDMIHHRNV
jgi:uncharacterized membrane protein YozB (DUF420 family)